MPWKSWKGKLKTGSLRGMWENESTAQPQGEDQKLALENLNMAKLRSSSFSS